MTAQPPEALAAALDRALRTRQAERLPSVTAAVLRGGEVVWTGAVGLACAEEEREATTATQYRIGSITKTFTAVAVMQLRDAGLLELDDRLDAHLPEAPAPAPTIRQLLAHLSGYRREPGEMWVDGSVPTIEELLGGLERYERVLPAGRAHHYSNLAYGLLGEVVARRGGGSYAGYVDERVIGALGLARTTWAPREPFAHGYLVDEYAGTLRREPHTELGGVAAMGQLWSTVEDLCAWAAFLAARREAPLVGAASRTRGSPARPSATSTTRSGGRDPRHESVLAAATVDELWAPQVLVEPRRWERGWGLGLELVNRDGRVFGGHGGAMPGHLAGVYVDRDSGVGAAVLTNSGTRGQTRELALELAARTIELWPAPVEPWRPEPEPPPAVRAVLGRWWSEGSEFVLSWERARLVARGADDPPSQEPAVFEQAGEREWRVVSGRERGERLRVAGDGLVWAGYAFTRDQRGFDLP